MLNVPTDVCVDEFGVISANLPEGSLDALPSFVETVAAIGKLKKGKACGPDGAEAEVLLVLDFSNVRILHEFISRIWTGMQDMLSGRRESYIVLLSKKGDLSSCSRRRGVLLASIPGKVFARILQARFHDYVEEVSLLPESQSGLGRNRVLWI